MNRATKSKTSVYIERKIQFISKQNLMKKLISIVAFWLAMLPVMAQTTLHVNGFVRDSINGNPIANHYVLIKYDSINGGNVFPYYHGMYTDASGHYSDTIQLPAGINTWLFIIETVDLCHVYYYQYPRTYNGTNTEFSHDFRICGPQGPSQPNVITSSADGITQTSAILHGFVDPNGDQTYVTFEFGTTTAYGTYYSCGQFYGDTLVPVSGTVSNLTPGTLYHFRINGGNAYGSVHGFDSTFITQDSSGCQAQYSHYPDSSAGNWSIQFIDLSSGNPTYWFWSFGDGTSSTLQNPVHTFGGPGNYYVCLTITGLNCTSTWCANITVENTPACVSYFTFEKSGLTVNYTGHKVNGYPADYQWNFGDGLLGQGQNIIHQYASPGIYYVSLTTVEDSSGCQYSSTQSVSVGDSAEYHQIYGQVFAGNFPLTTGLALIFSIDTSNNYNPYIDVCYIDSLGIYYFPMVPLGNYVVYALPFDSNGYLPTYYGDVLYWENASVIFSGQPDNPYNIHLLPAGNRVNGNGNINGLINYGGMKSKLLDKITMQLMDSDGNMISFDRVSTQGDFIFPSLAFGTYFLKAEIAGIRSDAVQVLLSTESPEAVVHMTFSGNQIQGIPETWKLFEAGVIYPNPVSNLAHIAIVTKISIPIDIELFTVTGKVVYSARKISETGEMNLSIPVSSLPAGIYTLRIYSEKGTFITRKLLKTQ